MIAKIVLPSLRDLPPTPQMVVGIATETLLRYGLVAGIAWVLGYWVFKKRWSQRKIIQRDPSAADLRRELSWSLLTGLIYGLVGTGTLLLCRAGWGQFYTKFSNHSMAWFWCSIPIIIVIHDTYFYWTHRLMHHRRLFRWFHRVHHQSTNPSPWAAYAFSPLEALVQAGIFPIVVFIMPTHPLAFMLFMIWQIGFNVAGHTGFEYHPRWFMDTWLGKAFNTPTHHVQHHERLRGNYGLYFNVWDRLMGTNDEDYERRFREVTSRSTTPSDTISP
jgi:Delta7-sterol 5-desaturase